MEDRLTFGWVYRKWYQQLYFNEINEVPLDGKHFIMCLWLFVMMCNMWNCSRVKCDSVYRFSIHSQSILKISIQHFHVRPRISVPNTIFQPHSDEEIPQRHYGLQTLIGCVCVCVLEMQSTPNYQNMFNTKFIHTPPAKRNSSNKYGLHSSSIVLPFRPFQYTIFQY